jgi:hypothetical protein
MPRRRAADVEKGLSKHDREIVAIRKLHLQAAKMLIATGKRLDGTNKTLDETNRTLDRLIRSRAR